MSKEDREYLVLVLVLPYIISAVIAFLPLWISIPTALWGAVLFAGAAVGLLGTAR